MTEAIILPPPVINLNAPTASKWQREYAAFGRLLPNLLLAYRGKYVAIHDEKVVDNDDDKITLALRVLAKIGNHDIHVGLVNHEPPPIARSGVRREVGTAGGNP